MLAGRTAGDRRIGLVTLGALLVTAVSLAAAAPAQAQLVLDGFVTHGDASAGWIEEPNGPPGATDQQSIELAVNGTGPTDLDDAARAVFGGIATTPPASSPSFDFRVSTSGGSGGSVRLLIEFADGGRGELRPVALQSGQWTHIDGTLSDWDSRGGSCGNRTQISYAEVLACHPGAAVTSVELVNDSGWLHPGGFQVLVDNVSYGGETLTGPAPPVLGESVSLTQLSGEVVVRLPEPIGGPEGGDLARLSGTAPLPVGTVVDTRTGRARLTSSRGRKRRQSAVFREGRFLIKQSRRRGGVTQLSLRGKLDECPGRASAAAGGPQAEASRRRRRLWGRGSGSFRTRGSYSSGSVRGTYWLTEDRCDGTFTRVISGVVEVRDFVLHVTVQVQAGGSYFAEAPGN